jgi:hypothetical protein
VAYDRWLTPAACSGLSIVLLEARLRRAATRGKKLVFSGSLFFKLLLSGGALGLSALLFQQGAQTEWWLNLLGVGFVLSFLFGWPKTIVTDERGIECHWWWRRRVFIPWDQVEYAETGKVESIEIVGTNARITFEGYNVDPIRFRKELTKRSKVKKVVTPGEFTGLHL